MFLTGKQIGRYYLKSLIEQGGMGDIYLAMDTHLHRPVACKVMKTPLNASTDTAAINEAVRLFKREAHAVTLLDHPHILPLYDFGEENIEGVSLTYFVMPYRQEGSLADWMSKHNKSGKLTLYEAAHFLRQAASALQFAHDHGIIHRDVKPSNFLIVGNKQHPERPDVQLADFGVAKFMRAISTPTGIIRGTPLYMPPEFWRGAAVPASDQYALALMIYEMITGAFPFQGETPEQLFYQHMYVEPPPPSTLNPSLSGELDVVLMRALSKNPANRYDSVAAFAKAFRQALVQKRAFAPPPINKTQEVVTLASSDVVERTQPAPDLKPLPPLTVRKRAPGRNKRNSFILMLALLLVISGMGFVLYSVFHQTDRTNQGLPINHQLQIETANAHLYASETSRAFQNVTASSVANDATNTAVASAAAVTATSVSATQTAVSATATAEVGATATSMAAATATAYSGIIMMGTNVLNNPMLSNNSTENWDTVAISSGAGCTFMQGTYHAGELQSGNFSACFEHGIDLTDFSYLVNMTILKGDVGGIAFRANPDTGTFYYFYIDTHGNYVLELVNSFTLGSPLTHGFNAAVHTGLNSTNQVAVVARGNNIQVYVNMQLVTQVTDSTVAHGYLGVVSQNVNASTDVSFGDAQAWQFK